MNDDKFSDAIVDFSYVIDGLKPKNDEEAILKSVCLLNRSSCHLFINKNIEATEDANYTIELYNSIRPEEIQKQMTHEQIMADPLTVPLSLAYLKKGHVFEKEAKLLEALQEYSVSITLKIDGEGQEAIKNIFRKVGIPEIDQKDPELVLFSDLIIHFLSEVNVLTGITNILTHLIEGEVPEKLIAKYNDSGCARILYGLIQLYIDHEMIVVSAISALRVLAEKGCVDSFNGFPVIRLVMDHWKGSEHVIGDCLRFVRLSPQQLYPYYIKFDFISVVLEALKLNINEEEIEAAYFILGRLSMNRDLMVQIGSEGILDHILERKTKGGLILLSLLSQIPDFGRAAERDGSIKWCFDAIKANPQDIQIISSGAIIIAQTNLILADPEDKIENMVPKNKLIDYAEDTFKLLTPLLMQNSKDPDVVANIFAAFATCIDYVPDLVREQRIIQAASAMLSMHISNPGVAANIVSLFFACAVHPDLNEDVKATRSALPTAITALKEHPSVQQIVERVVALACIYEHPKKEAFLIAGLRVFPESDIMKQYTSIIKMEDLEK